MLSTTADQCLQILGSGAEITLSAKFCRIALSFASVTKASASPPTPVDTCMENLEMFTQVEVDTDTTQAWLGDRPGARSRTRETSGRKDWSGLTKWRVSYFRCRAKPM